MIRLDTLYRNIRVYTTTLDFPSVPSNGSALIDVPVAAGAAPLGTSVRLVPLTDASSFDDMVVQATVVTADSIRFVMINPTAGAIDPASTDFAVWTGQINTDLASVLTPPIPPGNIALAANTFQSVQSFGTNESIIGIRLIPGGFYQYLAEPTNLTIFWTDINLGTNWIDDGGASAAQFEAQLVPLNVASMQPEVWTGWTGFNQWLPCNQILSMSSFNGVPAFSTNSFIVDVQIRQISTPANIVTGVADINSTNEL
jgi:hypothetical protein